MLGWARMSSSCVASGWSAASCSLGGQSCPPTPHPRPQRGTSGNQAGAQVGHRQTQALHHGAQPRPQSLHRSSKPGGLARDGGKPSGKQVSDWKRKSHRAPERPENTPAFRFKSLTSLARWPESASRVLEFLKGGAKESSRPAWAFGTVSGAEARVEELKAPFRAGLSKGGSTGQRCFYK